MMVQTVPINYESMINKKKSDSRIQKRIGRELAKEMSRKNRWLNSKIDEVIIVNKVKFSFDLYNESESIILEIYLGMDNLSSYAKKKVASDCLKMIYFDSLTGIIHKKKIVLIDKIIASSFIERDGWVSSLIKHYNIEVLTLNVSTNKEYTIRVARAKQGANKRSF